jgi:hypothetical protein
MKDSKNPIASCWQKQPPLKTNFYLSVLQMESSSTCLITASLCEGPFFYFYVESPPSNFMHCLREHSCHSEFNVHSPKLSLIDSWLWFHLFLNYLCLVALLNLKASYAFMFCYSMKDKLKTICYVFPYDLKSHLTFIVSFFMIFRLCSFLCYNMVAKFLLSRLCCLSCPCFKFFWSQHSLLTWMMKIVMVHVTSKINFLLSITYSRTSRS